MMWIGAGTGAKTGNAILEHGIIDRAAAFIRYKPLPPDAASHETT
jgi:hypothetical protein